MNPVHTHIPYFPMTHFNINFLSIPGPSKWSLPFRPSIQNFVSFLIHPMHGVSLAHLILFDLIIPVLF
jgi:hypothetical protein